LLGDLAVARQDPASALDQFQSAIKMMEELIARAPNNGGWRNILAIIYNKSAAVRKCRGDIDGALGAYDTALAIRKKLLDDNLQDLDSMLRVARSENLVGEALQLRGEPENGLDHFRRAEELAKLILAQRPADTAARDVLARASDLTAAVARPDDGIRGCAKTQVGGG
jgi:tetratricopeptide (TPR) repeat protein